MENANAKQILDAVVGTVFGYQNPFSLEQARDRFAFDVRLPKKVYDAETGEETWAASFSDNRYLTPKNVQNKIELNGMVRPDVPLNSFEDIMREWHKINYAMSERQIRSSQVVASDGVYNSENVYHSIDVRKSKNILFSDGIDTSDCVVAGQTSKAIQYSIRVEDSKNIDTSFNVVWSNKISRSLFIQDCFELQDCMFCTHLASKQYCIANIQVTKEQYEKLRTEVVRWILTS